jgi:hypothetical protein
LCEFPSAPFRIIFPHEDRPLSLSAYYIDAPIPFIKRNLGLSLQPLYWLDNPLR